MAQSNWQPIETAPSDMEILVYTRQWGAIIARRSEEHGEWLSRMQVPVSLTADEDGPTHWQSLPEPPDPPSGEKSDPTRAEAAPGA